MEEKVESVYADISENEKPMEIESLCMNCRENGITKLLLTKIPFFKEVILMCFQCEQCGYKSTEIQPGQSLQDKGLKIILAGQTAKDIQREIVKSEYASIFIKELELEIPANKKGVVNTIEGFLTTAYEELEENAKQRLIENPELGLKLNQFLSKLKDFLNGEILPFELIIDDPSGNSYLQNFNAPNDDPLIKYEEYIRTKEQLENMGYNSENQVPQEEEEKKQNAKQQKKGFISEQIAHRLNFAKPLDDNNLKQEVQVFTIPCFSCCKEGEQKMCTIEIPYFKELIVMSFVCEFCGGHSTEVKPGGEISAKGKKITLLVKSDDELKRELFKSDSARLLIPELDLELQYGTLGSVYSTTEGLLEKIQDNFSKNNPFMGDSEGSEFKEKIKIFLKQLKELRSGTKQFTLIFDDPLDNSFIQNPFYPNEDPLVKVEIYERNYEQNEEFGLNDMKTENYEKE